MNFLNEAKDLARILGESRETAIELIANRLEIAYITGQKAAIEELKK
jgi:hypothetical protein